MAGNSRHVIRRRTAAAGLDGWDFPSSDSGATRADAATVLLRHAGTRRGTFRLWRALSPSPLRTPDGGLVSAGA